MNTRPAMPRTVRAAQPARKTGVKKCPTRSAGQRPRSGPARGTQADPILLEESETRPADPRSVQPAQAAQKPGVKGRSNDNTGRRPGVDQGQGTKVDPILLVGGEDEEITSRLISGRQDGGDHQSLDTGFGSPPSKSEEKMCAFEDDEGNIRFAGPQGRQSLGGIRGASDPPCTRGPFKGHGLVHRKPLCRSDNLGLGGPSSQSTTATVSLGPLTASSTSRKHPLPAGSSGSEHSR